MSCIFCQIAAGEVPSEMLHQDDEVIAFRDIGPKAPIHILVVPKKHIATLEDMKEAEMPLIGKMTAVAQKLAREEGVSQKGYRLIINCGLEGGQVVPHLHMHLLGGRQMSHKMG